MLTLELPDDSSDELKAKKDLTAEQVAQAAKNGEDIAIKNAYITGDFILNAERVTGRVSIQKTTFRGKLDWSYAVFDWIVHLEGCVFEEDLMFTSTKFGQDLDFANEELGGGKFIQKANFNGVQIEGNASFMSTRFDEDTDFVGAYIAGQANFRAAEFLSKVKLCSFNGAQIDGHAIFGATIFAGDANFVGVRIGGEANFRDAKFKNPDSLSSFAGARIDREAIFASAKFEGEANFIGVCIVGQANFRHTEFNGGVSFNQAEFGNDAAMIDTVFGESASFPNATFRYLTFADTDKSDSQTKLGDSVDLRGCRYDRVHPTGFYRVNILDKQQPFHRQPYAHLEDILRRAGRVTEADDVYYSWRNRQWKERKTSDVSLSRWAWPLEWFLGFFTGYGVRLRRLWGVILTALLLGIFTFGFFDAALEAKPVAEPRSTQAERAEKGSALRWITASLVTLDMFLPVVRIPMPGDWQPSSQVVLGVPWFIVLSVFLTLTGWVFVPVGIAGLTGVLKTPL